MSASTGVVTETSNVQEIADRFVRFMAKQDLAGVVGLYAPGAAWEVHVPGWDDLLTDPIDLFDLHQRFFGRDRFRIDRYELTISGGSVALNWDLGWRDRETGLPAASFQSHFFHIEEGAIQRHRMYCAGVRLYNEPDMFTSDSQGEEG